MRVFACVQPLWDECSFLPLSVIPAIVVIAVGGSNQYDAVTITTDDGASQSMQVFPEPL